MANIGALLRQEIQRLARKEVRGQVGPLRKLTVQYRQVIADLRRRLADLERIQARAQRVAAVRPVSGEPVAAHGSATKRVARPRFSAESLRAERARVGLSAAEYARLVGVSDQTIYNWEQGRAAPRAKQAAVLAALRGIGKRAARARLDDESSAASAKPASSRARTRRAPSASGDGA